jgi:hypothetical protein
LGKEVGEGAIEHEGPSCGGKDVVRDEVGLDEESWNHGRRGDESLLRNVKEVSGCDVGHDRRKVK